MILLLTIYHSPFAIRRLGCPADMQQTPDVGEFGEALAAEQVLQVHFQKAGAGERGGVAQQAQLLAVADHAPAVFGAGVEQLLQGLEGGFLSR
ncbi:hypothetical protein [Methylocaldum sp. GT1BB]